MSGKLLRNELLQLYKDKGSFIAFSSPIRAHLKVRSLSAKYQPDVYKSDNNLKSTKFGTELPQHIQVNIGRGALHNNCLLRNNGIIKFHLKSRIGLLWLLLLPKAAHYSSPVRFRFANYMQPRSRFWDVCTYGFRFMTFFDVTEILKNITYSRQRFNFPNTLVATREQHRGP